MLRPLEAKLSQTIQEQNKVSERKSSTFAKLSSIIGQESTLSSFSKKISHVPLQSRNNFMMKYLHEKDRIAIAKKGILSELSFLAHESRKMHEKRKILENHLAAKKQEFEMIKDELEQTILHEYASSQTQSSEHQKSPDLNSIAQIDRHAIQSHTFNHINNTGNEPILLTSPADFDHNLDQHATVPFKVATSPQGVSVEIFHKGLNDKKQHQLQETIEEILKNNGFKLKKVKVVI